MDPQVEKKLAELKETQRRQREKAAHPAELLPEAAPRPQSLNLWELSAAELDQEMADRLTALNGDIDVRPAGRIASHRKIVGPFIIAAKRLLRLVCKPHTNLLLDRQVRFNADLVAFHLACFIRFRRLEERLSALEERLSAIEERQLDLTPAPPQAGGPKASE